MEKIKIKDQVKTALIHAEMTQKELAEKLGMSPQSLRNRLETGKFTREELDAMAAAMGARYISMFAFPDGKNF